MKSKVVFFVVVASLMGTVTCGPDPEDAGLCIKQMKEGVMEAAKKATDECVKEVGISEKDTEFLKKINDTLDDKGLSVCILKKLGVAKDDGTIDLKKITPTLFSDDVKEADLLKVAQSCMDKSEAKLKDVTDKAEKSKKGAVAFLMCFHQDFCLKGKA